MAPKSTTMHNPNRFIRDDYAYMLPMFVFLGFVWLGSKAPSLYVASYVARALVVAALLIWLWPNFTKIRWNGWWLGIILGAAGFFQWILMQDWLEHHFKIFQSDPAQVFDPTKSFNSPAALWGFISLRIASATFVVPVMEELFWRDFLWRTILAPNDFKLARIGEWAWPPFLIVPIAFASVHGTWCVTAVVWGLLIAGLLVRTRNIGPCIIMHGVTNFMLGIYVVAYQKWDLW